MLGFASGIAGRAHRAVEADGVATAVMGTFGISAVVWAAFVICPALLLRAPREPLARMDAIVAAFAVAAFALPVWPPTWVALTGIALYLLVYDAFALRGRPPCPMHRGAWVLLAITGAMFWGHLLLSVASGPILATDALLVGWLAGADTIGNLVRFGDGTGYVWIAPSCSSLANLSLAVLCWTLFSQSRGLGRSWAGAGWCLLACLSVVAINVTRISLMVLYRGYFELIHGPAGAAAASWLSVAAVLGVCLYGTRHDRLTHA